MGLLDHLQQCPVSIQKRGEGRPAHTWPAAVVIRRKGVVRQVRPKAAQHGDSRPGQLPVLVDSLCHADITLWTDGQGVSEHTSAHAALPRPMHAFRRSPWTPPITSLLALYIRRQENDTLAGSTQVALFVQSNCSDSKFLTA